VATKDPRDVTEPGHLVNVRASGSGPYPCPCCGYLTMSELGGFEICPVCGWEDDGQGDHDADTVRGGPNGSLSLAQARTNFVVHGYASPRFRNGLREPHDDEHPLA
jgi:hypothetical protein